jgi:hypothetical protein
MILRLIPMVIAFLLLGAHFLRGDHRVLVGVCLLAPFILLIKKRWARLLAQWLLYLGALVWLSTALGLMHSRLATGQPWIRMLAILTLVAAFTLWAGLLLNSARIKQHRP